MLYLESGEVALISQCISQGENKLASAAVSRAGWVWIFIHMQFLLRPRLSLKIMFHVALICNM